MKLDKHIISETATVLGLTEHRIIDIAEDLWNDALCSPFNMDDIIYEASVNFGRYNLNDPQKQTGNGKVD